jgi:hypothetical protein
MRIQKKNNSLYQSKLANEFSTENASDVISLNSDVTQLNSVLSPISGNITALSGNIVTLNNNINSANNNVNNINTNLRFWWTYLYEINNPYSTNSTTPFEFNLGTFNTYTKKSGTVVLITITFSFRTNSFTGGGAKFYYSLSSPTSWEPINGLSSPGYYTLGYSQTTQFSVDDMRGAGTYTFRFAASVNNGAHTIFIDNVSLLIQEIRTV